MPVVLKIAHIAFLLLMLFRINGGSTQEAIYPSTGPAYTCYIYTTDSAPETESTLTNPDTLQNPEAIVTPWPSFQFGFTQAFSLLILVFLWPAAISKVLLEVIHFVCSYFRTLFSTLIQINAP